MVRTIVGSLALAAALLGTHATAQSASPSTPGGVAPPTSTLQGSTGVATLNFGDISPATASETLTVSVAGAEVGNAVQCNALVDLSAAALVVLSQWVSAPGEVSINLFNPSTVDSVDLPATDFACLVVQ